MNASNRVRSCVDNVTADKRGSRSTHPKGGIVGCCTRIPPIPFSVVDDDVDDDLVFIVRWSSNSMTPNPSFVTIATVRAVMCVRQRHCVIAAFIVAGVLPISGDELEEDDDEEEEDEVDCDDVAAVTIEADCFKARFFRLTVGRGGGDDSAPSTGCAGCVLLLPSR
jgi:hypothetical protein